MVGDGALDLVDGGLPVDDLQHVAEIFLRHGHVHFASQKRRMGKETGQRALQFAHVRGDPVGQEFHHPFADPRARKLFREQIHLALQDSQAQLVAGRVDVDHQAGVQTAHDPLFQPVDLSRSGIRAEHDLLFLLHQCVERMKEFLLRGVLSGDELHIIDHQHID